MAFTTGTATSYHDLLDKFRTWITVTAGWTQLAWTPPILITDEAVLNIRGPGAGAGREVFVNIRSQNNVPSGFYGWQVTGATSFIAGPWGTQPTESPGSFFNLWQNTIDYWFYGNTRRFMIVAKVSSSYMSMHAGFFMPYALPDEYPFPLYIAGGYPTLEDSAVANARNRFFVDPGDGSAHYLARNAAAWNKVRHHDTSALPVNYSTVTPLAFLWPYRTGLSSSSTGGDFTHDFLEENRPNLNGEMLMWQMQLVDHANGVFAGVLDGVYATGGFNRSAEQLLTNGGRNFRLFQNVFRSTNRDFMAIEEI